MTGWDAGPLIALLRLEPGASATRRLIRAHAPDNFIHAINLYEIYYGFLRDTDHATAERAVAILLGLGLQIRRDMDEDFWKDAAEIKATHRLSVADSFAVALARRLKTALVSTDHHELDAINAAGVCSVIFVR